MKHKLVVALLIAVGPAVGGMANADTITVNFDDLPGGPTPLSSPYAGLNWICPGQCVVVDVPTYSGNPSGYQGALVSSPNVLTTAGAGFAFSPVGGGTFSFNSAYITAGWDNGVSVSVLGMNGTNVVDSRNFITGDVGVQGSYTFDWNNLTSVSISTSGGTPPGGLAFSGPQIGVDNLTYTTPVPLPAAAWLMLSALGALLVLRKRDGAAAGA